MKKGQDEKVSVAITGVFAAEIPVIAAETSVIVAETAVSVT